MIYSPAFLVASPADQYQSGTRRVDFQTNQGVVFALKRKTTRFLGGLRQIQFSYELFGLSRPYRSRWNLEECGFFSLDLDRQTDMVKEIHRVTWDVARESKRTSGA